MMIRKIGTLFCLMAVTLILILPVNGFAQDNGQNLRFQGISEVPDFMVKASAMGGAYTAVTGDLPSLFYNPAGLADLKKLQISVSGNSFKKEMWEDNFWWGGGADVILVRLWDGSMPLPPRELEGKKAYEIWPNETLPDFHIPVGTDYFDKARADWIHQADDFGLNSAAAALPIALGKRQIVVSGGFSRSLVEDYDKNPTRLIPHPGRLPDPYWSGPDPNKTTLWTVYERARTGPMNQLSAAVAVGVIKQIKLGVAYHQMWGKTDDNLSVKEIMQCNLTNADHDWTYAYKDGRFDQTGTSEFKTSQLDLGVVFQISRFNFGIRARFNSDITRTWEYTNTTTDAASQKTTAPIKGTDKIEKIPPTLSFGLCFTPKDYAKFSFDLERTEYSKASQVYDAAYAGPDGSSIYNWVDQTILRAGMEIKVHSRVSLLAGYQFAPKTWAPFRAAFDWEGQPTHIYSFGASIGVPFGNLDVAYQITRFKYYDAFMYGVPNNTVHTNKILFGYTFTL
jgi:long-subunit fatty acid transport protein